VEKPVTTEHYPIFDAFTPFKGYAEAGTTVDFLGVTTDAKFDIGQRFADRTFVDRPRIALDDEFFGWISMFEAICGAQNGFTFVELGAGYGRWSARAMAAARQKGIQPARAILVEAEPAHARWAHEHMRSNGFGNFRVIEAAVGTAPGRMHFVIDRFDAPSHDPRSWYGQAFNWTLPEYHRPTGKTHEGRSVTDNGFGWGMIDVEVINLDQALSGCGAVDLIDMDIQGAEADVIEASVDLLASRVKRIHVETHSKEVEVRIRSTMDNLGWTKTWDFTLASRSETPFGPVDFEGGVQGWINPRFR
jgi:FkbM family methyltransferase